MYPLDLRGVEAFGSPEEIRSNIVTNLARGLPEVVPGPLPHDGSFVLCGSGPSLLDHVDEIKAEKALGRPVVAIKGAHDVLVAHGVIPDVYLSVEVRDRPIRTPQKECLYLLASRCPPGLFESLKDYSVQVFHTWDGKEPIPELKGKPLLTGGSTSGLRAVTVGYAWGFRRFVMYGYDSCLAQDGKTKRITGESVEEHKTLYVHVGNRAFKTNGAMALQAQDFRDMIRYLPDCQFEVKGDGLIAAIYAEFLRRKAA